MITNVFRRSNWLIIYSCRVVSHFLLSSVSLLKKISALFWNIFNQNKPQASKYTAKKIQIKWMLLCFSVLSCMTNYQRTRMLMFGGLLIKTPPKKKTAVILEFIWLECLPIVLETRVQFQFESYKRFKKWYLVP